MTIKPVVGTLAVTLQDCYVLPPGPPHTYFGVAESFLPAVELLASSGAPVALPLSLLAAHTLECLLKAHISKALGSDKSLMAKGIRHNLVALWDLAVIHKLPVSTAPPDWVRCLGGLHDSPYYLRYSTGVHGVVSPAPQPMTAELRALLELVRQSMK
jgi:hypothetical protein